MTTKLMPKAVCLPPDLFRGSHSVYVTVKLNGKDFPCLLEQRIGGTQPYRTQFDISIDGTINLLSAGPGLGVHSFTIFEGPFDPNCPTTNKFLSTEYENMRDIKNRIIKIAYSHVSGHAPTFSGIINSMGSTQACDDDGNITMTTNVEALGVWS